MAGIMTHRLSSKTGPWPLTPDPLLFGKRLDRDEGRQLWDLDLLTLGAAADRVRRCLNPGNRVTFVIDRNINYTNVCTSGCRFCAFFRRADDTDAYVLDRPTLYRKIEETLALGGDQILLQGGMHPQLPLEWYEDLLRDVRQRYPQLNV